MQVSTGLRPEWSLEADSTTGIDNVTTNLRDIDVFVKFNKDVSLKNSEVQISFKGVQGSSTPITKVGNAFQIRFYDLIGDGVVTIRLLTTVDNKAIATEFRIVRGNVYRLFYACGILVNCFFFVCRCNGTHR